jgi:hypothetical protein
MHIKKWGFLLLLVLIYGCATQLYVDEHADGWISRPLSDLKETMSRPDSYASKIGWQETTYPLSNGYYVFVEPVYQECSVHWKINPRDMIVGYSVSGEACALKRPEKYIETITPRDATGW